ncbi:hypothetical protein [Mycoplasmopsis fermentans]|nr:hypothetical protein [Mycoplasmopsis fermentans]ADN68940.1 hypothetical membrane spanning protein [Mycoplasmopsis fermentans JER]ADV34398.1 Conserved Hypothetical Protein [Mycoplasmopsis fermentans M64]VEU60387.1 Uncharacterised protein [Mycoplasmopsis fermentans]VEU67529.1 Uncharacterised protein [Mesomycoplasma conjunctivae]
MSDKGKKIKYASVITLSIILAIFTVLLIIVAKGSWMAKVSEKSGDAGKFLIANRLVTNGIFADFSNFTSNFSIIKSVVESDTMVYIACGISALYFIIYISWIFTVLAVTIKAFVNKNWFIAPIMLAVFVTMLVWLVFQFFGGTFKMTKESDEKFIGGVIPFIQFFTHIGVVVVSIVGIIIESVKGKEKKNVWETTNSYNAEQQ